MKRLLLLSVLTCVACQVKPLLRSTDSGAKKTLNDLYQKGISEREAHDPDSCLKTFQDLIELRKKVKDSLYVYSLFQSGLCYEMKDQVTNAIAVYQDALRVKGVVPEEFYELEVPSRLAIGYSKLDELQSSQLYYEQSKRYLLRLQKNKAEILAHKEHYAETLYQMGIITNKFKQGTNFESYMNSIKFSQEYLTLALELNVEPYSHYAAQQLMDNFHSTYDYIASLQPEKTTDPVIGERMNQDEKKRLSIILLDNVSHFHAQSEAINKDLRDLKQKLETIISERPMGEGLTPEAQKLQDIKINGKLIPLPGESE